MKWKESDFRYPFKHWTLPELLYPCPPQEKDALHALKSDFHPVPPYKEMEAAAREQDTLVSIDVPLPDGQIAFLENTAEKCTSPQTKHSQAGMQGARHWVQRVDTPEGMFRRLTDGYGVSLMFGERCHQYIRNSNTWRGVSGVLLDIDVFRDEKHPDAPEPVYSQAELFERYPLLQRICSYLIPSASSLYEGRPFKARGVVILSQPITDQRVFRALGDILCGELDCIPKNVTKNPVAVGFGNTHNAPDAVYNDSVDTEWIATALEVAKAAVMTKTQHQKQQQKKDTERKEHHKANSERNREINETLTQRGYDLSVSDLQEPISTFNKLDPAALFVEHGLATNIRDNVWHWHASDVDRSFELDDGVLKVYSNTMQSEFPSTADQNTINAHRFLAWHIYGHDMTEKSQRHALRCALADAGIGTHPDIFKEAAKQRDAFARKEGLLKSNVPIDEEMTTPVVPIEPVTTLPPDHPIIKAAPTIEVREIASYPYFSPEARTVVREYLAMSPDAGWHGTTPVWTPKYKYLHPLTNTFAMNGQPTEVEKRRVWSTLFGSCQHCGADTAKWIDRYLLTAGVYCDGCHKDYPMGSYLEYELNRTLPNSIVSDHQGFIGDDPEFSDFRMFEPGMLTHMGSGMSTGKTTEICNDLVMLANDGLGKGVIATPNIAVARFLAHQLRKQYGRKAWGLWHEGVDRDDRFLGEYGAIACLPSLPSVVKHAQDNGAEQLYVAIDELDFSYGLLALSIDNATAVKKCLRDVLDSTGLVVSGQTESTLALEAFAEELETDKVQGFYNTATQAQGSVVLHKHENTKGKQNAIVASGIQDITDILEQGFNAYVFTNTRRDAELIANEFREESPVVYSAYTKGMPRADAVLRNQKLTDTRVFVGTSAAGVGLSILDPKARTVVLTGIKHGARDASMTVQQCVRDRGRCGVSVHYTDYNLALPVRPTENYDVSLYHEILKQIESENAHISTNGLQKVAYAQALNSLADLQFEQFVEHHLTKLANMPVSHASSIPHAPETLTSMSTIRKELRNKEKDAYIPKAIEFIEKSKLLTSSEIRIQSNKGRLTPIMRLAYEAANAASQSVGWDDTRTNADDTALDVEDMLLAVKLVDNGLVTNDISAKNLAKQRRGYFAVHQPKWTANQLQAELECVDAELVMSGGGVEITSICDDRRTGELLTCLLDRLTKEVFDEKALATTVREVLHSETSTGKPFITELQNGAFRASGYRKARFLKIATDAMVVEWVRAFIQEWYPQRIAKLGENYYLTDTEHMDLRLASFKRWLLNQPSTPEGTEITLDTYDTIAPPEKNADLKETAQFRRHAGETIKAIAEDLEIHPQTVGKWCKGIKPLPPAQQNVLDILGDGEVWKTNDIVKHARFAKRNVWSAIKALLEAGKVSKPKRGYYQKNGVTDAKRGSISN